jgi:tetratricopeptide (TPR) repeat protein
MQRPRLFVSFAGADRQQVRRLFARLEAQSVAVWNYADEAQEIPGGTHLASFLCQRIDRCDAFLPVVTPNSLTNPNTGLEVAHALDREEQHELIVIPLVLPECDEIAWPPPYDRLKSRRYRPIEFGSAQQLENTLIGLCKDLHVAHIGLITTDRHLPFMDRFEKEIAQKVPFDPQRDNAVYGNLHRILADFNTRYEDGCYADALARMTYFTLQCEYEFPHERFYYPYVVKAVCEILCGRLVTGSETLNGLLDHPMLDENVFGALGYVAQQQGLHDQATAYYMEALRRDPNDAAARSGVVANALLCRQPDALEDILAAMTDEDVESPVDRWKVQAVKAFAFGKLGRWADADILYRRILTQGLYDARLVANYADMLEEWGQFACSRDHYLRAREVLLDANIHFPDELILSRLASLCCITGDRAGAERHYRDLIERFPNSRHYRYEAAYALWHLKQQGEARNIAVGILDGSLFDLPRAPDDFYYCGFANWLLDRRDRAAYDFERSGRPRDEYYDRLLATA